MDNHAFIDAQNFHLSTTKASAPWRVDLARFRVYLSAKYKCSKAYYFIGAFDPRRECLYTAIQDSGFIIMFREHGMGLAGRKKGNVDVDIVFSVMRSICEQEPFDGVVLVSGDGDYKRMVDYLIAKERFCKLLIPDWSRSSSLYRSIPGKFKGCLSDSGVRQKIERK